MKRRTLVVAFTLMSAWIFCQDDTQILSSKEQRALAKEQRKADQLAKDAETKELTAFMLEKQQFVLEADYVGDASGQRVPVSSDLNFVLIDSLKTTLQLGGYQGIGLNGVGGITVDGRVNKYELKKNVTKKGYVSYSLIVYLMCSVGNYDITLIVSELGNADATVRGSSSGQLRYYGKLVPIYQSRVYKGSTYL